MQGHGLKNGFDNNEPASNIKRAEGLGGKPGFYLVKKSSPGGMLDG